MKTNVLVGWCKEIYGVAVEKFPDRPFTYKELRTAIEWEEYHPEVKSLDAVLLANLQTLRNREIVTFVSRGVYQLTGATAPVIESTVDSSVPSEVVPVPPTLTPSQSAMMEVLVHGAHLLFKIDE